MNCGAMIEVPTDGPPVVLYCTQPLQHNDGIKVREHSVTFRPQQGQPYTISWVTGPVLTIGELAASGVGVSDAP